MALAGQDLLNVIEGITAQVIAKQKRELESATAANMSMDNGFTRGRDCAAQIANVWQWAAEARRGGDKKNGMLDVAIRRVVSALQVNGKDVFAWFTEKKCPRACVFILQSSWAQ